MSAPWIVIASIVAVAMLYVFVPLVADTFRRFRATRSLRCPVTGQKASVHVDAGRAALTSAFGRMLLRVQNCSLWPERRGCGQYCVELPEIEGRGLHAGR
jgi:hypothetical protein